MALLPDGRLAIGGRFPDRINPRTFAYDVVFPTGVRVGWSHDYRCASTGIGFRGGVCT